jgi:hypothetical protein
MERTGDGTWLKKKNEDGKHTDWLGQDLEEQAQGDLWFRSCFSSLILAIEVHTLLFSFSFVLGWQRRGCRMLL